MINTMPDKLPTLTAGSIDLRPWRVEDAAWYVAARDEAVFQWTTEKRDLTVAETEAAIRRVNAGTDAACFAIVDHTSQALLGNVAMTLDGREGEVMYWLAPAGRGRGAATQAVVCACDWAFQSLGLERITLMTLPGNLPSQKVALRAGFRPVESAGADGAVWFERLKEKLTSYRHATDMPR